MKKRFHWASVIRGHNIQYFQHWTSEIFIILWVCTFKVGTYYLFMQVMTKTYDSTLGSYSGLMVELVKVTVKNFILGTGILQCSTISQQRASIKSWFWTTLESGIDLAPWINVAPPPPPPPPPSKKILTSECQFFFQSRYYCHFWISFLFLHFFSKFHKCTPRFIWDSWVKQGSPRNQKNSDTKIA